MEKERIGLFGGTFNPIHSGHLRAAKIVKKRFFLEKIFFIPSYIPPHKESAGIVSARHRLRMVELALRPYSSFVPCSIEVEAREKSYSIITLNKLKKLHPKALIFFILGVDAFLEIETWKDYEQVLEECYFVVIDRPGYRLGDAKKTLKGKYQGKMHKLSESEPVRDELLLSYKIFLLPIDALDVASTEVRERIRKGESIKDMVSKEVEAYIMDNRLYQTQKMPRKRVKKTVSKRSLPREVRVSAKAGKAKKGEELIVLDLRGICSFTDFFVIMHGNSTRQNVALYESVEQELKKESIAPLSVEGVENAEWILMDYGNFIVHVFSRNAREYYSLEKLWGDALKFSY